GRGDRHRDHPADPGGEDPAHAGRPAGCCRRPRLALLRGLCRELPHDRGHLGQPPPHVQADRSDHHAFLMLNVVFLMTIAFLPWPTALVAEYIRDPAGRHVAAAVYGLSMVAIAVMFNLVWWYAAKRGRLLVPGVDPEAIARTSRSYLIGPIVYG